MHHPLWLLPGSHISIRDALRDVKIERESRHRRDSNLRPQAPTPRPLRLLDWLKSLTAKPGIYLKNSVYQEILGFKVHVTCSVKRQKKWFFASRDIFFWQFWYHWLLLTLKQCHNYLPIMDELRPFGEKKYRKSFENFVSI